MGGTGHQHYGNANQRKKLFEHFGSFLY